MTPGAALSALRRRVPHICPMCRESFTKLKTARYCSDRCKQAAKYRRSKKP